MPLLKNCPADQKIYYTENGNTPRNLGWSAKYLKEGTGKTGRDGNKYTVKGGRWVLGEGKGSPSRRVSPRKTSPRKTSPRGNASTKPIAAHMSLYRDNAKIAYYNNFYRDYVDKYREKGYPSHELTPELIGLILRGNPESKPFRAQKPFRLEKPEDQNYIIQAIYDIQKYVKK